MARLFLGTGRLGEEGAEPDVETRYYDDGFMETGWYAGEPNGELWTGPHSTEAAALAAARKAHRAPACGLCARVGTNDLGGPREHSPGCRAREES